MTDVDEEESEEEQDPRVRTISSRRIVKLPNKFYLKHGQSPVSRTVQKLRRTQDNNIFSF